MASRRAIGRNELWSSVDFVWDDLRDLPESRPPGELPPLEHRNMIVDVASEASLRQEERRSIQTCLAYCDPNDSLVAGFGALMPLLFDTPIDYTTKEVVRIAPAIPTRAMLGVFPQDGRLKIWGIINSGPLELNPTGGAAGLFTVTIVGPESLVLRWGPYELARLRYGEMRSLAQRMFATLELVYSAGITSIEKALYHEIERDTGGPLCSLDEHVLRKRPVQGFLGKVLQAITGAAHGGALVLVPDSWMPDHAPLSERLHIKYRSNSTSLWAALKDYCYFNVSSPPSTDRELADSTVSHERWLDRKRRAASAVEDWVTLCAALAAVDGAVVITDRMRLLGFGAEVLANPTLPVDVVRREHVGDRPAERISILGFGTRNRSAARLCWSSDAILVFVISQDGDIRMYRRVGDVVRMWDDAELDSA
jgi:hypothetical protein